MTRYLATVLLVACGSAPDASFTSGSVDVSDAGPAGATSRPFRELRPAGGAATGQGGSTETQGDSGPMRASGGSASPAAGGASGGSIAAGGSIAIDAGGKQGSGGVPGSGGTAPGTGGAGGCVLLDAVAGCKPHGVALCGPQPDGCGGIVQCTPCHPCEASQCPGTCPPVAGAVPPDPMANYGSTCCVTTSGPCSCIWPKAGQPLPACK